MTGGGIWRQRASTLRALGYLAIARLVVRLLPFHLYRQSLGVLSNGRPVGSELAYRSAPTDTQLRMARRIERAAMRLPGDSKCFAKSIALHWMLRRLGQEGELVVAIHRTERSARHSYHAWLEIGGVMLVAACERDEYRELMRFSYATSALRECGLGPA